MRKKIIGIFVCTLLALASTSLTTLADWDEEDGHKMHWPQMPDPFGWDVDATYVEEIWPKIVLADDWQCSETGTVTDIHFWGSWFGDNVGTITAFVIAIHTDIPADPPDIPYSRPGKLLWEQKFYPDEWIEAGPWEGVQGFYDPGEGYFDPENHFQYWQYNIENITDPFIQEEGDIYWLAISAIVVPQPEPFQPRWGWKSSQDHWNDDACWSFWGELYWIDLLEPPYFTHSLDLAFVITGEEEHNHPPYTPSRPIGPTHGNTGISYTFSTNTTDPEGDKIKYGWDWDGDYTVDEWTSFYSSGTTVNTSYTWTAAGTYNVFVKAEDEHGAQNTWFSPPLTIIIYDNMPPNKPSKPSGPTSGKAGTTYSYSSSTIDLDEDQVFYLFDWGDGTDSGWLGPYNSGDTVTTSKEWTSQGNYQIRVKANDTNFAESEWSDPLSISMPKNKILNSPITRFLEQHPRMFPILRSILGL